MESQRKSQDWEAVEGEDEAEKSHPDDHIWEGSVSAIQCS